MILSIKIQDVQDKTGKMKRGMFCTLRTEIPTGRKILGEDSKPVDELMVVNTANELPKETPLGKEIDNLIANMLIAYKKQNNSAKRSIPASGKSGKRKKR